MAVSLSFTGRFIQTLVPGSASHNKDKRERYLRRIQGTEFVAASHFLFLVSQNWARKSLNSFLFLCDSAQ